MTFTRLNIQAGRLNRRSAQWRGQILLLSTTTMCFPVTVTDRVAWSVDLSVGLSPSELCKNG